MPADNQSCDDLAALLRRYDGLDHLRVKKYGDSLILLSGKGRNEQKHAKLTSLGRQQWGLSLPRHTGRWERTPYVGTMDAVLDALINDLGFYLTPIS
jgi:hypothetical protein